jgi:hypothetical protein
VTPKVDCSWVLTKPVDNLNAGANVLGGGDQKALPESGSGFLQAGGHSLSAEFTATGSFNTFEFEKEWVENDVEYRSFTAGFHCGVGQGLSGGTVVYVYQAID